MDQAAQLGTQTALVSAVVWAIVQVLKQIFPKEAIDPRAIAVLMAVVLGIGVALLPQLKGILDTAGGFVLAALGASFLHNLSSGSTSKD